MAGLPQTARPLGETLDHRQKMVVLASLMTALFIGALDQTVVATATPKIVSELGGFSMLSWMFTSYMLASTVVVPLVGKMSDIFGRKIFLIGGISLFMVASALCGAAPNMPALILFRVIQGLGGGMIFASVFATVGDLFPPSERGKYIGMFTGTFSLASILGPTIGGVLTDHVGWRWVFYINIPVALVAIPAVWMNLPSHKSTLRPKIDFLGAILLSIASVLLLLALVWAGDEYAWGSAQILGLLAGAAIFVGLFILQEARHPAPIVPLHLFKNGVFTFSNLTVFTLGMGMFGAIAYLPTFVQTSLGASATASGVVTTPQSMGVLAASIVGGQVIARTGRYKWQTAFGASLIAIAMVALTTLSVGMPKWHLSGYMVILGLGFGLVLPTMSLIIQNAVSYEHLGVASSSSQFFRQIGGVMGTAIFGAILATSYPSAFTDNLRDDAANRIPAESLAHFDDPTLKLDARTYNQVRTEVLAIEGGDQLLAAAEDAQKEGVSDAVHNIFLGAAAIATLCFVFTLFMPELPLRRSIAGSAPQPAAPPPGHPVRPAHEEAEPASASGPAGGK